MKESSIAYQTLRMFAFTQNYNRWIYRQIQPYLGQTILEVGCGLGNLTEHLRKAGKLLCIDTSARYISYLKIDFPGIEAYDCDILEPEILLSKGYLFDSVVCLNVLEHIEDDLKCLSMMYRLMKPGGRLLLLVPAHQFLYGEMDRHVGHYRRYSRNDIVHKVEQAGFRVQKASYFNRLGALGWFFNCRIRKKKQTSVLQLLIFDKLVPVISKIEAKLKLPFGVSLLVVAEKGDSSQLSKTGLEK